MEKFNLKKLNYMEVKEQHKVKISNKFAALEYLMTWISIGLWKVLERI